MRWISSLTLLCSAALMGCGEQVTQPLGDEPPREPPPDRIAFASTRGGNWTWPYIYVANGDGTSVRQVALGSAPAWSWDGRRIAFYRDANPYDRAGIYVVDSDGFNERYLGPGRYAAWSPDGQIAVAGLGGIEITMGGERRRVLDREWLLATLGEPCDPDDPWSTPAAASPAWSPDGGQIMFLLTCGGWSTPYVMNSAGGSPRLLLDWESRRAGPPAWSPDGSAIALIDDGWLTIVDQTWDGVTSYDLSELNGLGPTLDWSPDGRHLALEAGASDTRRIFVVSLDGWQVRQLLPGGSSQYYSDFDVAWSRVGRPE
jgi:Tol biopolymer transport system component